MICFLFLAKCRAKCLAARACMISLDIYMLCTAPVIRVVDTFDCLTVDADLLAWMRNSACKTVSASFMKALTACIFTVTGMLAAHHDIAFTAAVVLIIGTITYATG